MSQPDPPVPLPPGIDRRGFLRLSFGGGVAVAAASVLPTGCAADYPQAAADGVCLQSLTPKEYAVARAAAEALLTEVPVAPARIATAIDEQLALIGDPVRGDMKMVLGLVEHLTPLGARLRRFTALEPEQRLGYLRTWGESRFKLRRGAYGAVKAFVYFFAFTDDATRALTGFPGPLPEHVHIPAYPVDFGEVA